MKQERKDLEEKTNKLNKECNKSETDLKNVSVDLENEINKNREYANKLKDEEKILRRAENELEQGHLKRESMMKNYNNLSTEHKILNSEIDRCMLTIVEYEKVNQDLQKYVRTFIECDEEARAMLNRREIMGHMLEEVQANIRKTADEIAHLR